MNTGNNPIIQQLMQMAAANPQEAMKLMQQVGGQMPPEIMAMLGGGGQQAPQQMPQQQMPTEGQSIEPDADDAGGAPDGDSDEAMMDRVHGEMMKMSPEDFADQIRLALEEGDKKAVQELMFQMEEQGMSMESLPPDLQEQLNESGAMDLGEGEYEE